MKSSYRSVRIAPKKAQLLAKMIRGKSVPDAMHILEHTNKKAARLLEGLLRSAIANASHNDQQDAQIMVIKSLIINKAQAYHRGVPMARGRVRPIRKFMSHIELVLGLEGESDEKTTKKKSSEKSQKTSQNDEKTVKNSADKTSTTSTKGTSASSSASKAPEKKEETSSPTSKSSASKKSSSSL